MIVDWSRVLFVGWGDDGGVTHYRSKLPARALGAEWVTIEMDGEPVAGEGHRVDHDVIVVQSCWEPWQLRHMQRMRGSGARVVANVDDWLPAVAKLGAAHHFSGHFEGRRERTFMEMLGLCDAVIVSTPWLKGKLETVMNGRPVLVCRNGIDLERYAAWRGKGVREEGRVVLGWAGGTGHVDALTEILPEVYEVLRRHPEVDLLAIGDDTAVQASPNDLKGRVLRAPWSDMHLYPRFLDRCDIMLAPAQDNDFYRGKSQLRFYEAAAMGKPIVAHEMYDEVGVAQAGYLVSAGGYPSLGWGAAIELLLEPRFRGQCARNALAYAEKHLPMSVRVNEYREALRPLMDPAHV